MKNTHKQLQNVTIAEKYLKTAKTIGKMPTINAIVQIMPADGNMMMMKTKKINS